MMQNRPQQQQRMRVFLIVLSDVIAVGLLCLIPFWTPPRNALLPGYSDETLAQMIQTAAPTPKATPSPTPLPTATPTASPSSTPVEVDYLFGDVGTPIPSAGVATAAPQSDATPFEAARPDSILADRFLPLFTGSGASFADASTESVTLDNGWVQTFVSAYGGVSCAMDVYDYEGKTDDDANVAVKFRAATFYLKDMHCLSTRSASVDAPYNRVPKFAAAANAIAAFAGDGYLTQSPKVGLIVRNGEVLAQTNTHVDLCALYLDGTMRVYLADTYTLEDVQNGGDVWQVFALGPSLLDENGKALRSFSSGTPNRLRARVAFGYYESGCFGVVAALGSRACIGLDGKSTSSRYQGVTCIALASLCEQLGMQSAYCLIDSGAVALYTNGVLFGHNSADVSDVIVLVEP